MIDPPLVQTVRIDRWSIARPLATPARCPDSSLCQGLACPPGFSPSCRTWRVWARWRAPFRRFGQVRTSSGRVASRLGSHAVVEPQGDSEACGAMRRQHFVRHLPGRPSQPHVATQCSTSQHRATGNVATEYGARDTTTQGRAVSSYACCTTRGDCQP